MGRVAATAVSGLTRRQFLKAGAVGGAALALEGVSPAVQRALAAPPTCGSLNDIEHVVIFIQENRSFDHYFGTYRGVRGYQDPNAITLPGGHSVFYQPVATQYNHDGYQLPYRLQTNGTTRYCTADITHSWAPQHRSWNHGAMDRFAEVHFEESRTNGQVTMGYYTRDDVAFFHALADAFTICDGYHCSVIGPTDPNRLYTMSASIDPGGTGGGPLIETLDTHRAQYFGRFTWTTMPEQLQARGISWAVYNSQPDATLGNNVLVYFKKFFSQSADPQLSARAFLPSFPGTFQADCASGNLPSVSWILAPLASSEHPPGPPTFGEQSVHQALDALMSNPALWAKTAVFITYDENGGFFDHVPPATAPAGTPGEYLTAQPLNNTDLGGYTGPIGLGFRVPMLVVSPFSKGGFVSSDVFDHTSTLLFLEKRFGAEVPNLTAWRRGLVGDMTAAFNFAHPDSSPPSLPATPLIDTQTDQSCLTNAIGERTFPAPVPQQPPPAQEPGSPRRPSGPVACGAPAAASSSANAAATGALPFTSGAGGGYGAAVDIGLAGAALIGVGAAALRLRRRREREAVKAAREE